MDASTSTMAEPLSISLRAWPTLDQTKNSLSNQVKRLIEQRGSIRNITEASLIEEVQATKSGEFKHEDTIIAGEPAELAPAGEDRKPKSEDIAAAREEILKKVSQARMESAQTLDFISLLLSKHAPKAAELTLSPYIKENMPLGCLGAEMVQQQPQKSEAEKRNEEMVGLGWRMQSLGNAADRLLVSAERLEKEVQRETRYWGEVLEIKEQGWPVCRLPREKHTLGVRFGFAEAHSEFRNRGLAALRRHEDGTVILDRGSKATDLTLRIRMLQRGKQISSSQEPVSSGILCARNCLFDEELHHELLREARNLVNQNVYCDGETILVPFEKDTQISMKLEPPSSLEQGGDSGLPNAVLLVLRLLLCHAHRQTLHRRSQPPPPIRETPQSRPLYSILRPLLEFFQHRLAVESALDIMSGLARIVGTEVTLSPSTPFLPSLASRLASANIPAHQFLVTTLIAPRTSSISFPFPSRQVSLRIDVHTNILPPTFGTSYTATTTAFPAESIFADQPRELVFWDWKRAERHVGYMLALDLKELFLEDEEVKREWKEGAPWEGKLVRKRKGTDDEDMEGLLEGRVERVEEMLLGGFERDCIEIVVNKRNIELRWEVNGEKGGRELTSKGDGDKNGEKGVERMVEAIKELLKKEQSIGSH
ncbi:MAG: hypothetical protein Q9214_001118 [Letrouitia sp. 1 TL-2023]